MNVRASGLWGDAAGRLAFLPIVFLCVCSVPASAQPADSQPGSVETVSSAEAAAAVLSEMAAAYQEPTTFYGKFRLLPFPRDTRITGTRRVIVQLWFQRPNLLRVKTPLYDLTCDGERLQFHVKKLNQYMVTNAPETFDREWFRGEPFVHFQSLSPLLALTDMESIAEETKGELSRVEDFDRTIRKRPCAVLLLAQIKGGPRFGAAQVFVDREHHLVRRVTIKDSSAGTKRWTTWLDVLKAEPGATVDPSVFTIKPPRRAQKVDRIRWSSVPGA